MVKIRVDPNGISELYSLMEKQAQTMLQIENIVGEVSINIDMQIAAREKINQSLTSLKAACSKEKKILSDLSSILMRVNDDFSKSDKAISTQAKDIHYLADFIVANFTTMAASAFGLSAFNAFQNINAFNKLFGLTKTSASDVTNLNGTVSTELSTHEKSLVDLRHQDGIQDTRFRLLGYETLDGGFDAHGLKLTSTDGLAIGVVTATTTVGVTGLAVHGNASSSWDIFGNSTQTNVKKGGKVTVKPESTNPDDVVSVEEYDGSSNKKDDFKLINAGVAAEVGVAGAVLDYNTKIGTDDYYGTVDANVKLLDADAGVAAGISLGKDGLAVVGKAEVGASLAEVEASGSISIAGVETKATVSAEIGVSASFEVGYKDGEFSFSVGAALGVGGKISFKIKLPKLW